MSNPDPTRLPDVPDIPASIIASGISDAPLTSLVEVAMQRLVASGVPIDRMNVGFRILHPLFDGMSITWTRETGAEVSYAALVDKDGSDFRLSPFYVMLSDGSREWRLRLDQDPAIAGFPLLVQLKEKGFTDYLALIVAFGGAELHPQSLDGIATSWSTRAPQGFGASDIAAMRGVLAPLALVFRIAIKDQITKAALNTFHGPLVGGRILSGTIKSGGIGVHFGDVVFGNAGTPERLKFGVLGRAVNEVARTADMAKSLKRPVVVSDEVARRSSHALADLGLHELRGIPQARRLWAMEVT
jgi:hypothetical protein